jgi:hypothetical protein
MRNLQMAAWITFWIAATTAASHTECIVEEQIWKVRGGAITRAGELAKQQQPILDEIKKINNKAKDPARPIGSQLSPQDLGRFSELRQRLLAIDLQQMLESNNDRDYKVVSELFTLIQKLYVRDKEPGERDPDYKAFTVLQFMRYAAKTNDFKGVSDISIPPRNEFEQCTLVAALHLVEHESITKLNQLPINEATQKLIELRSKSPTPSGTIDRSRLSPQDRAIYDSIMRTAVAPGTHEETFIGDLEGLKNIVKAADLKFQASKKDAVDSGGEVTAIGQTLSKIDLDNRTRLGLVLLAAIAETFPSQWLQQKKQMQELMEKIPGAEFQGKK